MPIKPTSDGHFRCECDTCGEPMRYRDSAPVNFGSVKAAIATARAGDWRAEALADGTGFRITCRACKALEGVE
jgi:hypothetical protein